MSVLQVVLVRAKLRERQQLLLVGQAARVEAVVALASGVKVPVDARLVPLRVDSGHTAVALEHARVRLAQLGEDLLFMRARRRVNVDAPAPKRCGQSRRIGRHAV